VRQAGENATRATPEVVDRAFKPIVASSIASRLRTMLISMFLSGIACKQLLRNIRPYNPPAMRAPIVENVIATSAMRR